jgi:hypothetical protein
VSWGSLDRDGVRRATLVRGFPVSWAAEGDLCVIEARLRPGGQGRNSRLLGTPLAQVHWAGTARGRPTAVLRETRAGRTVARQSLWRPVQSPPGGDNGLPVTDWRSRQPGNGTATQCGPGCDDACAKYPSSVQQPHGDGRFGGGRPVRVRRRGADFHEGEHRGGTRSSERVRRPDEAVGRRFLRGDRRPGPAHLSLP